MIKKAAIWIVMLFVLMNTCLNVQAAKDEASGLEYKILEDGSIEITGYSGNATEVEIPEEINGVTVTSIGMWAFGETEITSIELPDSLKKIDISAFNSCQKLKTIHIPKNVNSIGMYAFYNCTSLESISVDDGNVNFSIKDNILYNKDGTTLLSCVVDKQIIEVPSGVTCIGEQAFSGCKRAEKVVLPEGVTEIKTWAFSETPVLSEVILPESLESIGDYVFSNSSLSKIHIPQNVANIGYCTFRNLVGEITVADGNAYYADEDNALYTKDKKNLLRYAGSKQSVNLPGTVETLDPYAFADTAVEEVILPNALRVISSYGFMNCKNLKEITIPESVQFISECAFNGCTNLSKVTVESKNCIFVSTDTEAMGRDKVFPENTKLYGHKDSTLEVYAEQYDRDFEVISGFTYEELEDGTLEITGTKSGYQFTEVLEIPAEIDGKIVTSIGGFYAFQFTNFSSVIIPETVKTINVGAFYGSALKEIVIPKSVETIGEGAFSQCASLTSIQVEERNPSYIVEDGVLYTKDKKSIVRVEVDVTKVKVPEGVEKIELGAFNRSAKLQEVILPDTVTYIGTEAFFYCENLTTINIPEGVEYLGFSAFYNCSSWTGELKLPKNIKEIGRFTFFNCKKLTGELVLPEGLTKIDEYAFNACCGLTGDLVIPQSVTVIGNYAFAGCNGMNSHVYVTEGTTSIGGAGIQVNSIVDEKGNCIYIPELAKQLTIHAPKGSYAEQYAIDNQYQYVIWYDFADVVEDAYYEEPVAWAVANGITNGYSNTSFRPDLVCTRGQVVTFLWRAKGCPEPQSLKSPFKDVADPDAYYYKAVLWAVENGITTGLNATTFGPDGPCTRGQVVTFMWRTEGKPLNSGSNPFKDLEKSEYYYKPVLWAVENGITTGLTSTTFGPDDTCTRGQIVTFLYRGMN